MARRQQQKQCRICSSPSGPWTKEDVFPKWLRKRILEALRTLPPGSLSPGWTPERNVALRPVCQPCQRRLNDLFENPAHPLLAAMIDGETIDLTPEEQAAIARWVIKTDLLVFLSRDEPSGGPPEPFRSREAFRGYREGLRVTLCRILKDGSPPPNSTVRLARVSYSDPPTSDPFLPPGWSEPVNAVLASVNHLPGLVTEAFLAAATTVIPYIEATKHDERFICVWPPHVTSVRWPPARPLGGNEAAEIRREWGGMKERIGGFPDFRLPSPQAPRQEDDLPSDA